MIRYVFDNKQALVDHLLADAKRIRNAASVAKPSREKVLIAEAAATESVAHMLESTFLRDVSTIQADAKI